MSNAPLRIVLCTSGGLNGALVLQRLLSSPHVHVVGIILSRRLLRASYGYWRGAWEYWRLTGSAYSLYLWCSTSLADVLLWLSPSSSVTGCARKNAIPVHVTKKVNSTEGKSFVENLAADLLVSAFFNQHIDAALTELPRHGAVNIHPSPLPEFRGVDPVFFTMLNGSGESGVSVHRITDEFDAGNILCRETCALNQHESVFSVTAQRYDRGGELLINSLPEIVRGASGTPQPAGGQYDSWPTPAQVATFRHQGGKLLHARDLLSMIRHGSADRDAAN